MQSVIEPHCPTDSSAMQPLLGLLPIRIYQVNLCWLEPVNLPFFHQAVITAFIRTLLKQTDHAFYQLAIHTPESGRTQYQTHDRYSFYITQFGDDLSLIEQLFFLLDRLPTSAEQAGCRGHISNNIALLSIKDALTEQLLAEPQHAAYIDHASLQAQVALWQEHAFDQLTIRFISPLRIKQQKQQRQGIKSTDGQLCRSQTDISGELLYCRIFDACANLCQQLTPSAPRLVREAAPQLAILDADLFWADGFYRAPGSKPQIRAKAIGGLLGEASLYLPELTPQQWLLLVLGQYVGIGANRRFGCGRYRLLNQQGESLTPLFGRAEPLTETIFNYADMQEDYQHELAKLSAAQQTQQQQQTELLPLQEQLLNGQHWPQPLTPRLLNKPGKKPRLLLLPGFEDKLIQKTLSSWLSDSLDSLYSANSYGYRRGRSRLGAKEKIQTLIRSGYRYVLDADIRDFFPSVETPRILSRLLCLYGPDPVWEILRRQLHAPIHQQLLPEGYEQHQQTGLNLGTSISPVLANLMLDHLDSVLTELDYQLIRYADDFMVLCKQRSQAEAALKLVTELLAQHGLQLNQRKTKIRSFASGVEYLGYLFINDMVVETKAKPAAQPLKLKPRQTKLPGNQQQLFFQQADKQTLCVAGDHAVIKLHQQRLAVERNSETLSETPLAHLECVVLFGPHQITTQALTKAMQCDVPVYFADRFGHYQGCAAAIAHNPAKHLQQAAHFSQHSNRLQFAQALVAARIRSQKEVLRSRKVNCPALNQALEQLTQAHSTEQCLGIEGHAAAAYWQAFAQLLPEPWQMPGRDKRHPKDPINSLLSFGYSLLYAHTDSLLRSQGLYPTLGGYHHARGTHSALASDLMEPFRYLIERSLLSCIKRGQIRPEQFWFKGKQCYLNQEARRFWLRQLIEQLQKPQLTTGTGEKYSALQLLQQQNRNLLSWLQDENQPFIPWQVR